MKYCNRVQYRQISAHVSSTRRSTTRNVSRVQSDCTVYNRMESDSHADTAVLGRNCVILGFTGRECDVSPYNDTYQSITGVPIVTGATAYTCQATGETIILVFHEALWMGDTMEHSFLNPNQLRHYGIEVQDNPYHASQGMHLSTEDGNVIIPLHSAGTTIYLDTRSPTDKEVQECRHIQYTSKQEWNPNAVCFSESATRLEEGKLKARVDAIRAQYKLSDHDECGVCDQLHPYRCGDVVSLGPSELVERVIAEVRVESVLDDVPSRRTFVSNERHTRVSPAELSERWGIGLSQATKTIQVTTQKGMRSAILPLSRRYRADRVFERPLLRGQFSTDTMDGRVKSLDGNRYAQVFATKDLFAAAYPMQLKSMAGEGLRQIVHDYGRPEHLTFDGSGEQCGKKTEFMKNIRKYSIDYKITEPDRPNHNFAEGVIREIRKKWYRIMVKKRVPRRLWDYGLRWVCDIQNRTSNTARGLNGQCPLEKITGESVDISEFLDFGFYDWVWFKDNAGLGETKLGKWLGVSHRIGTLMSFGILTAEGQVMPCTTVQRVTNLELQTTEVKSQCHDFSTRIADSLGDPENFLPGDGGKVTPGDWIGVNLYDEDFQEEFH